MLSPSERAHPLLGRIALVTGGQQGIGRAIALELAAAGADVAITWLDDEPAAEQVADAVRAQGRRALAVRSDVSVVAHTTAMVAHTVQEFGGLDIMVNNAGTYPRVKMLDMLEDDWDLVLDVNLKGTFFGSKAAARAMIDAGTKGVIISLASRSIQGAVRGVHYSASKGGIVSLTRAMALELAPHGIRVNAIAPGLTNTAQPRYGSTEDELLIMGGAIPLGRIARPDEIATAATFLASDAAAQMTGQTLHINGGSYMP